METARAEWVTTSERPLLSMWKQFTLSFYWLTWNIQWIALLTFLIPTQVLHMVGDEKKGTALGIVTMLGAIVSLILPPLIGAISDRTRTRLGRRRPYLLWGSVMDSFALLLMAFIPLWLGMPWAIVGFVVAYVLLQFGSSVATSPYAALIPDIVPASQVGSASGWMALMTFLGTFFGTLMGYAVGALDIVGTYWLLLGLFVMGALVTMLWVREPPAPSSASRFEWQAFWRKLYDPLRSHNFRWVFLTRMFVTAGIWSVYEFLLYYFRATYFPKGSGPVSVFGLSAASAEQGVTLFLSLLMIGALVSSWLGGRLSDKIGRRPMVYVASGLMSVVMIAFTLGWMPSFSGVVWLGLIFGLGYGAYIGVDWALACDVLPSKKDFAKDMGVWHIAMMIPQVIFFPIEGFLLDVMGYQVIFAIACLFFVLGTVFISKLRGVR
ncbi:MFS transporter [Candidatus Acetothermia bacterium]|nr:MFS transporter [Candidatus Acetothermia bacterium]